MSDVTCLKETPRFFTVRIKKIVEAILKRQDEILCHDLTHTYAAHCTDTDTYPYVSNPSPPPPRSAPGICWVISSSLCMTKTKILHIFLNYEP